MLQYRFTESARLTLFNDNSGLAIYNVLEGNTVFLNTSPEWDNSLALPQLPQEFTAEELAASLAISFEDIQPVIEYLLQQELISSCGK